MNYKELTKPYIETMFQTLREFVAIDSTYDELTRGEQHPFGKGVTNALNYIAEVARKDGFNVTNYDNMVVEISTGEGNKNITIMAHADIVPVGTGWKHDPFEVYEENGVLYGRGVADDKGPLLAAYYALKALKDNNLLGNYRVRFLVGGNEERGSLCMEHYFHTLNKEMPTLGFTPDSDYPLIFAEKGIIGLKVRKKIDCPELISLEGGVASNSVIEKCDVKVKNNEAFNEFLKNTDFDYTFENGVFVFHGQAAHGSVPWEGKNAGMAAITALAEYTQNSDLLLLAHKYNNLRAEGVNAGGYSEDMGTNSWNVGLMALDKSILTLIVNFRYVETCDEKQLIQNIKEASKPFEVTVQGTSPLLYFKKDSVLVSTLMKVYQEETGDLKTPPQATGGGTYAKEADNVVAFGMQFPGWDSKMHAPGECARKEDFIKSLAIYAHAIVELGKKL